MKRRAYVPRAGFFAILCALCFILANEGLAQTANQAQLTREQAPSPFPPTVPPSAVEGGHVVAAPGDADLGEQQILKRVEGYQPFTISVGMPFYWTSNVALTSSGEESDFVLAPAAAAFYEPRITSTLYGLIDVREQLFYYDRFDSFDFGALILKSASDISCRNGIICSCALSTITTGSPRRTALKVSFKTMPSS